MRTFVRMRESLLLNRQLAYKPSELEVRLDEHDAEIQEVVEAIRELMSPLPANHRRIGFEVPTESAKVRSKALASIRGSGR